MKARHILTIAAIAMMQTACTLKDLAPILGLASVAPAKGMQAASLQPQQVPITVARTDAQEQQIRAMTQQALNAQPSQSQVVKVHSLNSAQPASSEQEVGWARVPASAPIATATVVTGGEASR